MKQQLAAIGRSMLDTEGCDRLLGETVANDLNPFPDGTENPSLSDAAEPAAKTASVISYNKALSYAASRENAMGGMGLLYPFKSEVFRDMLDFAGKIGEKAPEIQIVLASSHGLIKTGAAAATGACH